MIPPPPRSPLFPYTTLFRSVVVGKSPQSIVVMAHRDDTGVGPGANENASGTAALIELARLYGTPAGGGTRAVSPAHTLVFLSTDGGAAGGIGAAHFVRTWPFRRQVVAVINLDAIGGHGRPRLVLAGDTARSPAGALIATA